MTAPTNTLDRGERLAVLACLIVCAVTIVASVGDASLALHNDGPVHFFAAEVHARYREASLGWQQLYQLHWPTSARGALELHLLARLLGAPAGLAHTVVLDVALLLWLASFFTLVLRLCPRRWPVAPLGLATAFQLSFELGVLPFYLGLSGSLLVLAFELGAQRSSLTRDAFLLFALLVLARIHVHPAVLTGVFVVAIRAAGPRPVRDVLAAVAAGLPALLVAATTAEQLAGDATGGDRFGLSTTGLLSLVRDFLPGAPWRGLAALALVVVSAVLIARRRRTLPRAQVAVAGVAVFLLCVATVVPEDFQGWQLARPRFLPLSFAALLALLPVELLGRRARALAALAFLLFGVDVALASQREQDRWQHIFRPVIEGLRQAPLQPRTWAALVTVVDEPVPPTRFTPWLHLAQLAAIEIGGRPAYTQDDRPAKHVILARAPPTSLVSPPFPAVWAKAWSADLDGQRHFEVVRALAAWGLAVDGLVVYGRPDDAAALWAGGQDVVFARELGFDRTVYSTDSVGCDVDVVVRGPSEPVTIGLGFSPGDAPLEVVVLDGADGVARLTRAPCGAVWLEVDAGPCAGADASGRLRAVVDRAQQPATLTCERRFP